MRYLKPVCDSKILEIQVDNQKQTEKRYNTGRSESTSQKLVRPPEKMDKNRIEKIGCPKAAQGTKKPKTT